MVHFVGGGGGVLKQIVVCQEDFLGEFEGVWFRIIAQSVSSLTGHPRGARLGFQLGCGFGVEGLGFRVLGLGFSF